MIDVTGLNAGQLRQSIQVQASANAPDPSGQMQSIWTTVLTTSAKVEFGAGRQQFAEEGFNSQVSHVVTLRYPSVTIVPGMRVLCKNHSFTVQYMDDLEMRGRWLLLYVLELSPTS